MLSYSLGERNILNPAHDVCFHKISRFFMRDLTEKKLVFKPWFGCIGTITVFLRRQKLSKKTNVNFEVPSFISIEDLF